MLDVFREAWAITKKNRGANQLKKRKATIAQLFNNTYTYLHEYDPKRPRLTEGSAMYGSMPCGGYAWMCPDCNKIHHPTECSVFSGLQYPGCCRTGAGNRLSHNIKTE